MSKNLHLSILTIKFELQKLNLKKSGKNKFANFNYYELSDFQPQLTELLLKNEVFDHFNLTDDKAILTLCKGEEKETYEMPFVECSFKGMNEIQGLGAMTTYYKRYLYMNAFNITDGDIIDGMEQDKSQRAKVTPKNKNDNSNWLNEGTTQFDAVVNGLKGNLNLTIKDVRKKYAVSGKVKKALETAVGRTL